MRKSKMPHGPNRRRPPQSGDRLTDRIFYSFSKILSRIKIYKIKNLRHPGNRRILYGFFNYDTIWINPGLKPKVPAVKILIHELWHALLAQNKILSDEAEEELVDDLENIFWDKFTDAQKILIGSYIPKHYVKLEPKK